MDDEVVRTDVTLYNLKCNTEELYLAWMKAVTTSKELAPSMSMLDQSILAKFVRPKSFQ